jgi:hypothetical protein
MFQEFRFALDCSISVLVFFRRISSVPLQFSQLIYFSVLFLPIGPLSILAWDFCHQSNVTDSSSTQPKTDRCQWTLTLISVFCFTMLDTYSASTISRHLQAFSSSKSSIPVYDLSINSIFNAFVILGSSIVLIRFLIIGCYWVARALSAQTVLLFAFTSFLGT